VKWPINAALDDLDVDLNYDEATLAQVEMIQKEVSWVAFLDIPAWLIIVLLRFKKEVNIYRTRKSSSHWQRSIVKMTLYIKRKYG